MDVLINLFSNYNIVGAFVVNIELTLWSSLFSLLLGVLLVTLRISPVSSLRAFASGYVEFFKNMPLTIIMVFMVLGVFGQLKFQFSNNLSLIHI